jgi:hypothetical protein
MEFLSMYLELWFLSSEFCNFSYVDHAYNLLDIFLCTSFLGLTYLHHVLNFQCELLIALIYESNCILCNTPLFFNLFVLANSWNFPLLILLYFLIYTIMLSVNKDSFSSSFSKSVYLYFTLKFLTHCIS